MKKFILFMIFTYSFVIVNGQKKSALQSVMVVWNADGQKYSLKSAKYGVKVDKDLTLQIYFHNYYFNQLKNKQNFTLEFRWYYYLSTRRTLMFVEKVPFFKAVSLKDNVLMFKSKQSGLQPGWWEVQVFNTQDNGVIGVGNVTKFQIYVKK